VSKLERLLNLTAALLATPRALSAEELRERIEGYPDSDDSWRRSFERDKDDLRTMGIPIEISEVVGTNPPVAGYRIDKERYGNSPRLEPDELAALHLAASLVRVEGLGEDAFWRLGGASGNDTTEGVMAELPSDPNLGPLFEAASQHRKVHFDYADTSRTVDAWRLSFARGRWYLSGFDHSRSDDRLFRVDRITSSVDLGEPYEGTPPNRPILLRGWELGDGDPTETRLLVDTSQVGWASNELGDDQIVERRDDGAAVFSLAVRNEAAFVSFVLTFLDHAEVLSPASTRAAVVEKLDDFLERHPAGSR
jgi:proteasome accessory factor B